MRKKELVITTMAVVGMMLVTACSKPVDEPVVEPIAVETLVVEEETTSAIEEVVEEAIQEIATEEAVTEVVEGTTEEVAEKETKFTIEKADVFAEPNEESQILMTLDVNHEVEKVSETEDGVFTEVVWLEGSAYIKTVLLADEQVELHEDWGTSKTDEQKAQEEQAEAEASTNEVTPQEVAPQPVEPAPQEQASSGGQSGAVHNLTPEQLAIVESFGGGWGTGTTTNNPGKGDGNGSANGKTVVFH